ncbi:GNAT family N-acetyltransferase [Halosimplex rubrum]|uniref:GNAT family N-acetyltransferase n=1 Tax=Halosimplex rubrum TaxID=869889 RepID=A0A7D5PBR1_9EURY|nr:N-acetyltransferase [Halosimplex rubrum]QLH78599.1 GNAT family N-acetyltransferase [Halosimplex rubrum]
MSVNVERRVVDPGDADYVEQAWQLKERIRSRDGVLRQRRGFFENAYERSTVYLFVDRADRNAMVGFAAVRRDGYILFLAVDSAYQGEGFGEALVARVAEDYSSVTCHARTTNRDALRFYQHIGFSIERRIDNYYEDGGDAYYLKLGEEEGLADRLSKLLGG